VFVVLEVYFFASFYFIFFPQLVDNSSIDIVEAKWRHHRAKVILKADSDAFKAAWPGVRLRANSMRVKSTDFGV
jgi:hypothetical protein